MAAAPTASEQDGMRLFIFKSELSGGLRAFAGESDTRLLPARHGPWHAVGVVREGANPPYNLRRDLIEQAIASRGYQLFRLKTNPQAS
jgi:hypothetical protein